MKNNTGELLKELRGFRSLRTVAELSDNEISHNQIRLIENRQQKPNPQHLKILAKVYNYSYEELMKIEGYLEESENKVDKLIAEFRKLSHEERELFLSKIVR